MANIVDTAIRDGSFSRLVEAVKAAGLTDTLSGTGPFTVFAPTDEAFNRLSEAEFESLTKDTEKLKSLLTYHVVGSRMMASDVKSKTSLKTVQGSDIEIDSRRDRALQVGGASIVMSDIEADNGVIHAIDRVIMPATVA